MPPPTPNLMPRMPTIPLATPVHRRWKSNKDACCSVVLVIIDI